MCYAIPGRIVELKKNIAIVDYFGERRTAINELENIKKGDYAYAQGGILVQRVPESEAVSLLSEWKEAFFQLKNKDLKISGTALGKRKKTGPENRIEKILKKRHFGKKELAKLLMTTNRQELKQVFSAANSARMARLGNSCCVHGIIEFSNYCRNDCAYCGIRRSNKKLERYRMTADEIVSVAEKAVKELGFKAIVLQSGEDCWYTTKKLCEIIRKIRKKCGVLLFVSVGSRSRNCYKKMYEAGARGVLLRFETSNKQLYKKLHHGPKANFNQRIALLNYCRKLGYIIATGALAGLPGQTAEDVAQDILLAKKLGAEMYSFGPLIPSGIKLDDFLKVIAATRFADPDAKILVTTALETLDKKNGARKGLLAGANSLMINITPERFRKHYSIYPKRAGSRDSVRKRTRQVLNLLYSLGRAPTDLGIRFAKTANRKAGG